MQKPIIYVMLALIIIVVALLAILSVLNVVTMQQALDLGVKLVGILLIGLVASLLVGMLGRNTSAK